MKNLSLYKKYLHINTLDELVDKFQDSLLKSNMTFSYFCDWNKIRKNVEKYKYEINILNYLVNAQDIKKKLREMLGKNPEVLKVIPLIIAVRDLDIAVIKDPGKPAESLTRYDFKKAKLNNNEIGEIISFCENSGILTLFSNLKIKDLRDYLLGVETGLDTNARKNRSGTAMESLITPVLSKIKRITFYEQKKFGAIEGKNGICISDGLRNRKFDYAVKTTQKCYNIEVNYYSGQGSKPQEIVDSYINRNNELKKAGWGFIWITDGPGWKSGLNQLKKAFKEMDYVLNVTLSKRGFLQDILT